MKNKKMKKIEWKDSILLLVSLISVIVLTVVFSTSNKKEETTIKNINPLEIIF